MQGKFVASMLISLALCVGSGSCVSASGPPAPDRVAFKGAKGINIHGWLTWTTQTSPSSYRLPVFASKGGRPDDKDIADLKSSGFDFVRLTVDPGVFVLLTGSDRDDALASVVNAIDKLRAYGLSVIVDMHPVRAVFPFGSDQGGGVTAFEKGAESPLSMRYATATAWLAGQIDKRYAHTHQVAFELMNEPDLPCGSAQWAGQVLALHQTVRAAAPRLALIVGGACSDGIEGLTALNASDFHDDNVLFTFHFYDDPRFTSAGSIGGNSDHDLGISAMGDLPYPWNARPRDQVLNDVQAQASSKGEAALKFALRHTGLYLDQQWDRGHIDQRMDKVAQWAAKYNVAASRILIGEFGANSRRGRIRGPHDEDRLRWLADVRQSAEKHGFRWAIWQYRGNDFSDSFEIEATPSEGIQYGVLLSLGLNKPVGK